jgi:hypothetical protein
LASATVRLLHGLVSHDCDWQMNHGFAAARHYLGILVWNDGSYIFTTLLTVFKEGMALRHFDQCI